MLHTVWLTKCSLLAQGFGIINHKISSSLFYKRMECLTQLGSYNIFMLLRIARRHFVTVCCSSSLSWERSSIARIKCQKKRFIREGGLIPYSIQYLLHRDNMKCPIKKSNLFFKEIVIQPLYGWLPAARQISDVMVHNNI